MFMSLLNSLSDLDCQVVFAPNVSPDDSLFGVLVNDGGANWVMFNSDHTARQFQQYCLSLGIMTLRQAVSN